jgi:hypothetical protein
MRTVPFNMNWNIRVKLKERGIAELRRLHEELRTFSPSIGEFKEPRVDENGYYRDQAWSIMANLGHLFSMGMDPPFVPGILLEVEDGPAQATVDKLRNRLEEMRDFCYGESRPHPANVQRLCDDVLLMLTKLGV